MDTGLCAYLTGWLIPHVLERGAMAGAIFETWAITEIIKSYLHNGSRPRVYFYRDRDRREVDLLIEKNGTLYPVEIKKTATVRNSACKGFGMLANLKTPIGHGAVLCMTGALTPLGNNVDAVNVGLV